MKNFRNIFLFCFLAVLFSNGAAIASERCVGDNYCSLSFYHLISSASKYDGKYIILRGVLIKENDFIFLYPTREAGELGLSEQSVVLDVKGIYSERVASLDKKYVYVQGLFNSVDAGRYGFANGVLSDLGELRGIE